MPPKNLNGNQVVGEQHIAVVSVLTGQTLRGYMVRIRMNISVSSALIAFRDVMHDSLVITRAVWVRCYYISYM